MEVTDAEVENILEQKAKIVPIVLDCKKEIRNKFLNRRLIEGLSLREKYERAIKNHLTKALDFKYRVHVSFCSEGRYNYSIVTLGTRMTVLDGHILLE
jgi:hypothetical protein